ncbi:hypothetical protein Q5752_003148 [Cryptotrichosporon argae]
MFAPAQAGPSVVRSLRACRLSRTDAASVAPLPRSSIFSAGAETYEASRRVRRASAADEPSADGAAKADPWYRMRHSPQRQCVVTRQTLPSDFLVRLKPADVTAPAEKPDAAPTAYIFPDGVLHPRRAARKPGRGVYATLHPSVVARLSERRGPHVPPLARLGAVPAPALPALIGAQLAARVAHEVALLIARVSALGGVGGDARPPVACRLTVGEAAALDVRAWDAERCVCVLDFRQSQAAAEDVTGVDVTGEKVDGEIKQPTTVTTVERLLVVKMRELMDAAAADAVEAAIRRLLDVERRAKRRALSASARTATGGVEPEPATSRGGWPERASACVALFASEAGLVTPLAIALCRLRLWRGYGWTRVA